MNVVDRFVVGVVELGERHKPTSWSRVLDTKNTNQNYQQDSTMMDTNSTKKLNMKMVTLKVIVQQKV
jgi:hypothetical protein